MPDLAAELRAYRLLQWQALAPLADFDEDLALTGYYTRLQRTRSDQAITAWRVDHPEETSPELAAFRELERLGVITQNDYYSPSKAASGLYGNTLANHQSGGAGLQPRTAKPQDRNQKAGSGITRFRPDAKGQGKGERLRLRRRDPRR